MSLRRACPACHLLLQWRILPFVRSFPHQLLLNRSSPGHFPLKCSCQYRMPSQWWPHAMFLTVEGKKVAPRFILQWVRSNKLQPRELLLSKERAQWYKESALFPEDMYLSLQMPLSLPTHLAQLWPLCPHLHTQYGSSSGVGFFSLHLKVSEGDQYWDEGPKESSPWVCIASALMPTECLVSILCVPLTLFVCLFFEEAMTGPF